MVLGWVIRSSVDSAQVAGVAWLIGLGLLIVGVVPGLPRHGSLALGVFPAYAVVLMVVQPSMRTDGDAEAAVIATAIWLVPAAAGGVTLPRRGRWVVAAGCWCLLLALSTAVAGTVSHRNSAIGLFGVIWD